MLLVLDLAVKGSLVLVAGLLGALLLRRASAASRCLVWSGSLVALLALPVLGAVVPAWTPPLVPEVPQSWVPRGSPATDPALRTSNLQSDISEMTVLPRPTPRAPALATLPSTVVDDGSMPPGNAAPRTSAARRRSAPRESTSSRSGSAIAPRRLQETTTEFPAGKADPQTSPSLQRATPSAVAAPTWLVLLAGSYFLGAAALLLNLLAGVAGVLRMIGAAEPVADSPLRREFEGAVAALGIERDIRLLETDATSVPVAWELWRPAVLMPRSAHDWPAPRRRVALLHELAHVRRRDCQMQLVAQLALAVYWPNPLAWCAVRRLRIEREHACDDAVLSLGTRASDYADHLLQIARGLVRRREPAWAAVAMARTRQLEGRVAAILDPENRRSLPRRRTIMTALIAALALLLPLAAVQPGVAQTPAGEPAAHAPEERPLMQQLPETAGGASSAAAGTSQETGPSIDDLVQMRIHGVSTEFIRAVRDAFGRPVTTRELVQMRIHGTTPEFVAAARELFGDELTVRDVTNMRIHGASIEYIREMQDALGAELTLRDVSGLRIHGASPEFARAMRDLLGDEVDAHDLTQMRIHGASEEFVREMGELLEDEELTVHDVTQMRIHGVTTELVRDLQEDGFENLTVDDLVKMKIHGFDRWLQRRRGGR